MGGAFLNGHVITVPCLEGGDIEVDGVPVLTTFPSTFSIPGGGLVTYSAEGKLVDGATEQWEKRIVNMHLPKGPGHGRGVSRHAILVVVVASFSECCTFRLPPLAFFPHILSHRCPTYSRHLRACQIVLELLWLKLARRLHCGHFRRRGDPGRS